MTDLTPHEVPDGRHEIHGKTYMGDGKGGFQPIEVIKPQHLLEDEVVRKVIGFAFALSAQMMRFKEHSFADIADHEEILAQEYNATLGGKKGNKTLSTVDGLFKVQVQVSDTVSFGPELQTAKLLFDECLRDWAADTRPELRSIVENAFHTDKEGQISRANIFILLRQESDDERWTSGQNAIRDAMRVTGSKTYLRCYARESHDAPWAPVPLDLSAV